MMHCGVIVSGGPTPPIHTADVAQEEHMQGSEGGVRVSLQH